MSRATGSTLATSSSGASPGVGRLGAGERIGIDPDRVDDIQVSHLDLTLESPMIHNGWRVGVRAQLAVTTPM